MKPSNLKSGKNALDRIWSSLVKRRDKYTCQHCGVPQRREAHLQSAHIYSRKKMSTRWMLANGITLCWRCHKWSHEHPTAFQEWVLAMMMPEERDYLIRESEVIVMVNQDFIEERKAVLRAEEANMPKEM